MLKLCWNALKLSSMLLGATWLMADRTWAEAIAPTRELASNPTVSATSKPIGFIQPVVGSAHLLNQSATPVAAKSYPKLFAPTPVTSRLTQAAPKPKPKAPPTTSYTGIGGDIGLSGHKTALGSGGLAILSKTRLTDNLSLHSATVVFGSRTATSMYALTVDTPIKDRLSGRLLIFPFLGAGVQTRNQGGFKVDPLISGGIDVPISRNFTATARVNVGFPSDRTDVGLLIGVGYNFSIFSLFGGR